MALLPCAQDWDTLCISELQAAQQVAGHQRAMLSTYPLGYDGEGAAAAVPDAAPATLLCAKEFDESGLLRVQSRWGQHRAGWIGKHSGRPLQRTSLGSRTGIGDCVWQPKTPLLLQIVKSR